MRVSAFILLLMLSPTLFSITLVIYVVVAYRRKEIKARQYQRKLRRYSDRNN